MSGINGATQAYYRYPDLGAELNIIDSDLRSVDLHTSSIRSIIDSFSSRFLRILSLTTNLRCHQGLLSTVISSNLS